MLSGPEYAFKVVCLERDRLDEVHKLTLANLNEMRVILRGFVAKHASECYPDKCECQLCEAAYNVLGS